MTKRLSAIIAAATLGLSAAAFAQTSTPSTQPPSAAPSTSGTGSGVTTPTDRTGSAGRPSTTTQSGTATNKAMSEAEVRKELEKQGYTRVSDVKKKGDHYEAKGVKDGKTVSLDVDAKSGKVVAR
jgi:uncharacterized membrane protein YkoI